MTPAEQQDYDELRAQRDRLVALLTELGDYAGVELVKSAPEPEPERPMGRLLHFPAARKNAKTGATGRTARSVTADAAPRRVSHLGNAS